MPPSSELMDLIFASKLLAKTVDELSKDLAFVANRVESTHESLAQAKETLNTLDKKLELLPLVLAGKLEGLIEKRTEEKYQDIRVTLDELRNKLWSIKKDTKFVKDSTGTHQLPTREQLALQEKQEEEKEGVTVRKGKWLLQVPLSVETWKVFKIVIYIILAIATTTAAGGGIWAFVDKLKHAIHGG